MGELILVTFAVLYYFFSVFCISEFVSYEMRNTSVSLVKMVVTVISIIFASPFFLPIMLGIYVGSKFKEID